MARLDSYGPLGALQAANATTMASDFEDSLCDPKDVGKLDWAHEALDETLETVVQQTKSKKRTRGKKKAVGSPRAPASVTSEPEGPVTKMSRETQTDFPFVQSWVPDQPPKSDQTQTFYGPMKAKTECPSDDIIMGTEAASVKQEDEEDELPDFSLDKEEEDLPDFDGPDIEQAMDALGVMGKGLHVPEGCTVVDMGDSDDPGFVGEQWS